MVTCGTVCLRQMGQDRAEEVRFGRFLANRKVTLDRLIEGWATPTAAAVTGRHVLAIQDTSEINIPTHAGRSRGLGEIGKGVGRGLLVHAMLALDANSGDSLGLVGGEVWTRAGRITVPHAKRPLKEKESQRWLTTATRAKTVLGAAAMVTVVADRESDIYAVWSALPAVGFHVLGRAYSNRSLAEGGRLFTAIQHFPVAETAVIEVRERADRPARTATLSLRFGTVTLKRPQFTRDRDLPETAAVTVIEVEETAPPAGIEPLHWRLLTTHKVPDCATAWQIVGWYKHRWTIEQLFRVLKTQGLRLEDSQIEDADRLLKLAAIATRAASVTIQLVQARDGGNTEPATIAFPESDIQVLSALNPTLEGKTENQKNPHPPKSMAWAGWIIGRLGGWKGYKSERPPGPITFKRGLDHFANFAAGWRARDLCMP